MKRSIQVFIAAMVQLVGSSVMLLFTLFMVYVFFSLRHHPAAKLPTGMFVFSFILYGALAVLGFATANGVLLRQAWARISTLVFSCLLLLTGAMMSVVLFLIPMNQPGAPSIPDHELFVIRSVMGGFCALLALIGGWWLWLFTRKSVAAQFARQPAQTPVPPEPGVQAPALSLAARRPVSITIIACLMLFGVANLVFTPMYFKVPVTAFFVWTGSGWPALAIMVLSAAAQVVIGIGLLRLRPWSRIAAMLWLLFGVANSAVFFCTPGGEARYQRMMELMQMRMKPPVGMSPGLPVAMMLWIIVCAALIALVQIYFLITRRAAFAPPEAPPVPCQSAQSTQ